MSTGLPSGLWELTMSRICPRPPHIRLGRLGFAHSARNNAQAALAGSPPSVSLAPAEGPRNLGRPRRPAKGSGPLTPRSSARRPTTGPIAEIEKRVNELKAAADVEVSASETLFFSEDALLAMYEDVLAHPQKTSAAVSPVPEPEPAQVDQDLATVRRLEQQLLHLNNDTLEDAPLIAKLRRETHAPSTSFDQPAAGELHHRVLRLANARLDRLDVLQPSSSTAPPPLVPILLFSIQEYEALTRTCINEGDIDAAEAALRLMKRSGLAIPEESLTSVLRQYTDVGNVQAAEHCLTSFLAGPPTEPQRHLHIKCHLKATPRNRVPESALAVLHSYESQGHPAPMKTYTSTIAALYSTHLSVARAQAWDLFSHMRYVAHPTPDVVLYTAMIRACASPVGTAHSSEPERALDLWTEMTVEQKLTPTVGSYNAVILACARSGRKMYVNEAFRIAKEMLDAHRDAYGRSAYMPDRRTLCALLEGAKRIGDLARARWILADLVKNDASAEEGVNEEIMMHVFHAYTSYIPPFTRSLAKVVPGRAQDASASTAPETEVTESSDSAKAPSSVGLSARFTRIPPQTGNEVIEEVQALFQRVLEDTGRDQERSTADSVFPGQAKFKHVDLSVRLVNSYLSVHYQHSSLEASEVLFWEVFDRVGLTPDARSYLEALERCGRSKRGRERAVGLDFAEKVWAKWLALEDAGRAHAHPVDSRMVERAHVAFMRVLALNGEVQRALDHIRAFAERYPPSHLYERRPKANFRSTRTVLVVGSHPLVRLTAPTEVPDDGVSPLLLFSDLELLHHRLVAANMKEGVAYVKYISKAYEWALRGRRDAAMKAHPVRNPHAVTTTN
ncbi:hypothetical protein C8R46DRAFT_357307 [Mycena filopes]|nr:hypothetical protein C8R46DRAFT_357307 [Mycena filopes]